MNAPYFFALRTPLKFLGVAVQPQILAVFGVVAILLLRVPVCRAEVPKSTHKYMGVASCSSSNCHGGVAPRKSSSVLQNEYITWFKRDKHAQAWKTLLSTESRRIAWQLGIEDPAHDKTCLTCHSTLVPESATSAEKFRAEDGVSCESCHGAAGGWISTHTASGTTHQDNLANGLEATENPAQRARLCLSCHQGDQQRDFSHRLYGAGHPRLSFELDTYATIQPAHWLNDTDYKERKGDYSPLEIWFEGQLAAAEQTLNLIALISQQNGDLFPELSAFTCSSCHHNLSAKQFLHRDYHQRTGEPRLNLSSLEMLVAGLQGVNAQSAKVLEDQLQAINSGQPLGSATQEIRNIISEIRSSKMGAAIASQPGKVLRALLSYGAGNTSLYYESAEQLAMALASAQAQLSGSSRRPTGLEKIFKILESYDDFKGNLFSDACGQYLTSLK